MGPRKSAPSSAMTFDFASAAATPGEEDALGQRWRLAPVADDTQHDAAVAIASLDVDRLHERIERVARRVQRLQRELGEVWEDMQRLLDPGAVAKEVVYP